MKLKFRTQLQLAFGAVLGLVSISSGIVFVKAVAVGHELDSMKETRVPIQIKVAGMQEGLTKARADVRMVVLSAAFGKTDTAKSIGQKMEQDWKMIDTLEDD
jgi:hypothetical protein